LRNPYFIIIFKVQGDTLSAPILVIDFRECEHQEDVSGREHLRGKYHSTVDLLFNRFGNVHLCSSKFSAPSTKAHF